MTEFVLECENLCKNYGDVYGLRNATFQIPRGAVVGLLGPNGSGKTTLIKCIAGLLTPTDGCVKVSGHTTGIETKKRVSYLPERTYLADSMRVRDVLKMFADFYEDFRIDVAREMLAKLSIEEKTKLKTMSKGTKEKVQLILVMSRDAELYLLDEPIGGVDPAARDYILNTIITNYSPHSSVIIATHLISDIERILDRVLFVREGSIVLDSSVDSVREVHGKSVDELFREVFRC